MAEEPRAAPKDSRKATLNRYRDRAYNADHFPTKLCLPHAHAATSILLNGLLAKGGCESGKIGARMPTSARASLGFFGQFADVGICAPEQNRHLQQALTNTKPIFPLLNEDSGAEASSSIVLRLRFSFSSCSLNCRIQVEAITPRSQPR